MKRCFLLCALASALYCSCSRSSLDEPRSVNFSLASEQDEEIVFEQGVPRHKVTETLRALPTDDQVNWLDNEHYLQFLGRSFIFPNDPNPTFGLRGQIINVRTMIKDPELEGRIVVSPIAQTKVHTEVFRDIEHVRTASTETMEQKLGFSIDLGIFSIGRTSHYEEKFFKSHETFSNSAFGSINIDYLGHQVILDLSRADRAQIIEKHLSPRFLRALYSHPMGEISQNMSPLILTRYQTGGRLTSMYQRTHTWRKDADSVYHKLSDALNMSATKSVAKAVEVVQKLAEKPEGDKKPSDEDKKALEKGSQGLFQSLSFSISVDMADGRSNYDFVEDDKLYRSITTWGGELSSGLNLPASTEPQSVDFSQWLMSLHNPQKHKLVNILDKGLLPVSEFILEANFASRLMDIYKGVLEPNTENETPWIEVAKVFVRNKQDGTPLCDIALVLHTRNGDRFILSELNNRATDQELERNETKSEFTRKGKQLIDRLNRANVYQGLTKSGKPSKVLYPYMRKMSSSLAVLNYDNMYRYHNPLSKVTYFYDERARLAFSCYEGDEGDADLLELYGLTRWKSLPEKKISTERLMQDFKVLGL